MLNSAHNGWGRHRRRVCCSGMFRWGRNQWACHAKFKVLQNHPLLSPVPKEHAYGVRESGQSGVDYQLTPTLACNQVEDELKSVCRQLGKINIPCPCQSGYNQSRGVGSLPNVNKSNQMGIERTITYVPLDFFIYFSRPFSNAHNSLLFARSFKKDRLFSW